MGDGGVKRTEGDAVEGGAWTVTAGPITRAAQLRAFIAAIGAIEGVTDLVAERFRLGELSLTLRYSGALPLAGCLAALSGFALRVETEGGGTIRLWIDGAPSQA